MKTAPNRLSWFPWNGSKRWMLPYLEEVLNSWNPRSGARYIEPFIGGGSVSYLARQVHPEVPQLVGDANPWLVSVYDWQILGLAPYSLPSNYMDVDYWRGLRDADLGSLSVTDRATRFAVCLLTAWGHRWKTEDDGRFTSSSAPVNKEWVKADYLESRLQSFFTQARWLESRDRVYAADWSVLAGEAREGDLLYLDPPYTETLGYGNLTWSLSEQLDVVDLAVDKAREGVIVVVSNHATIERLYRRAGFKVQTFPGPGKGTKTRKARDEMLAWSGVPGLENEGDWLQAFSPSGLVRT